VSGAAMRQKAIIADGIGEVNRDMPTITPAFPTGAKACEIVSYVAKSRKNGFRK
jgi:hypothetical protein